LRLCKSSRPGPVRRTARPPVVYVGPMPDTTLRAFGWKPLLIHGDPCVLDRWLWLRRHLRRGRVRTFDAGCGNGAFSIYAARCGNDVLAASFSPREQEDARRRAQTLGVAGIDFRTLDLREGRGDILGLRLGHRLHRHGRAAADRDGPDVDLAL